MGNHAVGYCTEFYKRTRCKMECTLRNLVLIFDIIKKPTVDSISVLMSQTLDFSAPICHISRENAGKFSFRLISHRFFHALNAIFVLPMRQSLFFLAVMEKFCLAHGLRQLTRDTICDVSCLRTLPTRRDEKLRMTFGAGHGKNRSYRSEETSLLVFFLVHGSKQDSTEIVYL